MNKATRLLFVYQLQQVLPGVITGVFAILLVLWFYLGSTLFSICDEAGKKAQHQVGTVTNVINRPVSRGNSDPAALVSIQVGTKQAMVNTHTLLHVGQQVSLDCTIGRSGTLYVDRLSPMVAAK